MVAFNWLDITLFICFVGILSILALFVSSSARRQKEAMQKMKASIKLQEQTNHQLGLMLTELRRSTRLLSNMVGGNAATEAEVSQPQKYSDAKYSDTKYSETAKPKTTAPSSFPDYASENGEADMSATDHLFKVYVGNVDYAATAEELAQHFIECGQVEYVNIPVNRYTGRARGFGFVSFSTEQEAERALALNGSEFKGRQIQVNFAKEREKE